MTSNADAQIRKRPVIWLLGVAFTSFGIGISTMLGFEHYTGMISITRWELHDLQIRIGTADATVITLTKERNALLSAITTLRAQPGQCAGQTHNTCTRAICCNTADSTRCPTTSHANE
jgi:hypothetical protein